MVFKYFLAVSALCIGLLIVNQSLVKSVRSIFAGIHEEDESKSTPAAHVAKQSTPKNISKHSLLNQSAPMSLAIDSIIRDTIDPEIPLGVCWNKYGCRNRFGYLIRTKMKDPAHPLNRWPGILGLDMGHAQVLVEALIRQIDISDDDAPGALTSDDEATKEAKSRAIREKTMEAIIAKWPVTNWFEKGEPAWARWRKVDVDVLPVTESYHDPKSVGVEFGSNVVGFLHRDAVVKMVASRGQRAAILFPQVSPTFIDKYVSYEGKLGAGSGKKYTVPEGKRWEDRVKADPEFKGWVDAAAGETPYLLGCKPYHVTHQEFGGVDCTPPEEEQMEG